MTLNMSEVIFHLAGFLPSSGVVVERRMIRRLLADSSHNSLFVSLVASYSLDLFAPWFDEDYRPTLSFSFFRFCFFLDWMFSKKSHCPRLLYWHLCTSVPMRPGVLDISF